MKFVLIYFDKRHSIPAEAKLKELGECVSYFGGDVYANSVASCDYIVSLGGDGTLLKAAQFAIKFDKPLIGINSGHLGFLCAFQAENLEALTLEAIKALKVSERTLLECDGHLAVNDVCILKKDPGKTIATDVKGIEAWRGDGVIVSTATGSTSYNESAGGEVLDPESRNIIVTAVCPHFAKTRTKTLDGDSVVVNVSPDSDACLVIDGKIVGDAIGELTVRRAEKKLKLLVPLR